MPAPARIYPAIRGTRLFSVLKHLYRSHADATVRTLARAAMSEPAALLGLHDYLDENGLEEGQHYNFRGAAEKIDTDDRLRRATLARHAPRPTGESDDVDGIDPWDRATAHRIIRGVARRENAAEFRPLFPEMTDAEFERMRERVHANASDDGFRRRQSPKGRRVVEATDARRSLYGQPAGGTARVGLDGKFNYARRPASILPALRRLRSRQQGTLRATAAQIQAALRLAPAKTRDALHDTDAFSAPGVVQALYHADDPDTVRYAAAWYGHLAQAPALAVFHAGEGPDALYRVGPHADPEALRDALAQAGVGQRLLVPRGDAWDALVLDPGRRLAAAVAGAAKTLKAGVEETGGRAEQLGDGKAKPTAKGRKQYRDVISAYEAGAAADK